MYGTQTAGLGQREIIAGLLKKIQEALGFLRKADDQLAESARELAYTRQLIDALPAGEQAAPQSKHAGWTDLITDLRTRYTKAKDELHKAWNMLKDAVGGTEGLQGIQAGGPVGRLGIPLVLVIGVVGAAALGVAKLWKEVVNETRRINSDNKAMQAVIEGKLSPEALQEIRKETGKAPLIAGVGGLVVLVALLFALPGLMKAGRS